MLCRRYDPETTGRTTDVCDPYNVVAIISGHTHNPYFIEIDAGKDANGDPVYFYNYVVSDSGPDSNNKLGWLSLHLTDQQLKVQWHGTGPSNVSGGVVTKDIDTSFVTWAHGEPNNSHGNEHCAEFLPNGRYNDLDCKTYRPVACRKNDGSGWWIDPYGGTWDMASETCEVMAQELNVGFGVPQSVADQKGLMEAIAGRNVWINYTDQASPGEWKSVPYYDSYFRAGQPNNGAHLPEKGWGENCGALKFYDDDKQLWIRDGRCENEVHHFLCRNKDNWFYISDGKGIWKQGFDICADESGMNNVEEAFVFPKNGAEYWDMVLYQDFNVKSVGQVWVNLNDIKKEGDWVNKGRPWEDDFASGQAATEVDPPGEEIASNEDEDCAYYHTWIEMLDITIPVWYGEWRASNCQSTGAQRPYACRSDKTGEWKLTTATGENWEDGFEHCRSEFGGHWRFDSPIRESDNDAVFWLIRDGGAPLDVWLNYTDAKQEGLWRHGRWEYWNGGEPNNTNGDENCGIANGVFQPTYDLLKWNDVTCSGTKRPIAFVRDNSEDENGPREWEVGGYVSKWEDADAECKLYGYRFGIPYCPSEMQAIVDAAWQNSASKYGIWIRYTDRDNEGRWDDWWSDWDD
ncbi:MAG: hypothetical protein JRF65_00160 [Deltaproteobacteria bacterium]|nr:hypothetical protein [Deltaproteobacteria bacterium]